MQNEQIPAQAEKDKKTGAGAKITRFFSLFSLLVALCVLVIGGVALYSYYTNALRLDTARVKNSLQQRPKLVFQVVSFSKYLIQGSPADTGYFDKLNIFLVKGTADIQFDMVRLVVDENKSDPASGLLVFTTPSCLPEVVVRINPEDTYQVMEIKPAPISEKDARAAAEVVGLGAGAVGAYVGAKAFSGFGGNPIMRVASGGLGGLVVGGAAGGGSYVATKNFLTGRTLASNSLEDKERMLNDSLDIIKLEIMGGELLGSPEWDKEIAAHYKSAFEKTLNELFVPLGWQKVVIVESGF